MLKKAGLLFIITDSCIPSDVGSVGDGDPC